MMLTSRKASQSTGRRSRNTPQQLLCFVNSTRRANRAGSTQCTSNRVHPQTRSRFKTSRSFVRTTQRRQTLAMSVQSNPVRTDRCQQTVRLRLPRQHVGSHARSSNHGFSLLARFHAASQVAYDLTNLR